MNQNVKPIYFSKTFWVNLIMAMSVMIPEQYKPMAMSPEVHAFIFLIVNTVLRLISKDKVTII
jgi:hypothetical protein